jgi:hypothetical protein
MILMDQPLLYERKFIRRCIGRMRYLIVGIFKWNIMPETKSQMIDPKQNGGDLKIKCLKLLLLFCLGSPCGIIFY